MKLVLEMGSNDGVQGVTFKIINVTSLAGFAGNASDPSVEGIDKDDDFSFARLMDQTTTAGTVVADRTYATIWAKEVLIF